MGFLSEKVARVISQAFADASKRRYEHILKRIEETLKDDEAAMLIIREGHRLQFPQDIEVFSVAPPALNEIHRWMREREEKADKEEPSPDTA
jgi:hypothetical protein